MSVPVKICGLKTEEAVDAALKGGAAYIGFIFFPKSPRNITPRDAGLLAERARGRARTVAVTVNADDALLDEIVAGVKPDYLQLHGKESTERVAQIKERFGLPVIKAFAIREAADLAAVRDYVGVADQLLFDAKPPPGAELPGGNGVAFDWSILSGLDGGIDYLLSGGLNAGNISEAIIGTGAPAIDVSSGVEGAPGEKDPGLIAGFFEAVRRAEQRLPA
ncbi:phosphoribosylanthranilate isomerase [Hoeflea prorocentri]|uniref:N-(5'-phosphoribosyl)anthranilate isomerase n=1 Tax=Hoeflea prorocentri TaxID=1922333 RepID=A0A9X3UPP8_9HYPH|nr:phosphoribosylanthranilate isomerase [Hoeflea prorocentri]MCY6383119.1 phosphoribosylanthranilate isomerase [Hoeflea prorocentri]MDA5400919.1 phosphoribosylanthranilate isomerase [Hoeflea prorocentri]